jgi:hypothetical protein
MNEDDPDPFKRPRRFRRPQDFRELDGYAAELECGHVNPPYSPDGHPYGQMKPGDYITCHSLKCQGQRKVVRSYRVPREA